ncbi:hypothetical protein PSKAS_06610 [Peribacillus sp. N1]
MKTDPQYEILVKKNRSLFNSRLILLYLSVTVILSLSLVGNFALDENSFLYTVSSFVANVGFSGIIVTILIGLYNKLK